jgi:hypothetical protein
MRKKMKTLFDGRPRAHSLTVTLRFSPSFGCSPVNLALANSKAVMAALAGPSHNSAVKGWSYWAPPLTHHRRAGSKIAAL